MVSDDAFPDRSMEHADKIAWMIETKGWAIEPVPPRPDSDPPMPGYAYTIGLESTYDFPEVVLFGLTPVAATGLAELLVDLVADGVEIPVGVDLHRVSWTTTCAARLLPIELDTYADLFGSAAAWHRGSTSACCSSRGRTGTGGSRGSPASSTDCCSRNRSSGPVPGE